MTDYTPEQQRVADYLVELTNGAVGAGDDPIGFLVASHAALGRQIADWNDHRAKGWLPAAHAERWRDERDEALGFLFAAKRLGLFIGARPTGLMEFMKDWEDDGF